MKKILVTGGAGFVGSSICCWLKEDADREVIAFDNKAGTGAPNTNNAVKLSGIIRLLPGDTIHIESSLDTNTTLPINQNYNQLSIVRISQ